MREVAATQCVELCVPDWLPAAPTAASHSAAHASRFRVLTVRPAGLKVELLLSVRCRRVHAGHAVALRDLGPTMAPMNAFLTIMGIETLALRMRQHTENAQRLAEWLEDHDKVVCWWLLLWHVALTASFLGIMRPRDPGGCGFLLLCDFFFCSL